MLPRLEIEEPLTKRGGLTATPLALPEWLDLDVEVKRVPCPVSSDNLHAESLGGRNAAAISERQSQVLLTRLPPNELDAHRVVGDEGLDLHSEISEVLL